MIDHLASIKALSAEPQGTKQNNLNWVKNDRMAGLVPTWQPAEKSTQEISHTLERALNGPAENKNFEKALSLAAEPQVAQENDGFGFFDVLDIINPLQHIPLVNHAYRYVTGDEIKPVSRVMGSGLFGGPLVAAGSLVSVMIEEQTGESLIETALNIVSDRDQEATSSLKTRKS